MKKRENESSSSAPSDAHYSAIKQSFSGRLGIIAGSGDLIAEVIATCEALNKDFFILAFEDQTDAALIINRPHQWTKLGKIGHSLDLLKQANVQEIVMAGRFRRPSWREMQPDLVGVKWLARLAAHAFGDDKVIKTVIQLLEEEGFHIVSPESIIGDHLFIPKGVLGKILPNDISWKDIERGREVLQRTSPLDIGQSIVIQQGLTLGIEAIEGTDELINRTSTYQRQGSAPILVKMCKQGQETRADRATVGSHTIEQLSKAGFGGLAIESNSVIVLNKADFIAKADTAGIFVVGI